MRPTALILALSLSSGCAWQHGFARMSASDTSAPGTVPHNEVAAGLREALVQGTRQAVATLGRTDGFWASTRFRVPLPDTLARYESAARRVGLGGRIDQFHLTLNRAAEKSVGQVGDVLGQAIARMTLADAQQILQGPPDAATQYFRRTAGADLQARILPIVRDVTAQEGVTQQYKQLTGKLQQFGMGGAVDLDAYVTERALQGLFAVMAEEEARIRANPAARGTELLRRVFGRSS